MTANILIRWSGFVMILAGVLMLLLGILPSLLLPTSDSILDGVLDPLILRTIGGVLSAVCLVWIGYVLFNEKDQAPEAA